METSISGQKVEHNELQAELDSSKQKETELLQFTQKITSTNTQLNSQNSALNDKVRSSDGCYNVDKTDEVTHMAYRPGHFCIL